MLVNARIHAEDDLLDTCFDLTDKNGIFAAQMKIALSPISGSVVNFKKFMKKVDDDVQLGLMRSLPNNLSTLGQIVKLTKAIRDRFLKVVHLSRYNSESANRGD